MQYNDINDKNVIEQTRLWLERAVIGLGLCPYAQSPYRQQRVRIQVSSAQDVETLLLDLQAALLQLQDTPAEKLETTLLVHPRVLRDFLDYNDFLDLADALLEDLDMDGEFQVASFHPQYCFADCTPDAPENRSNRSPYPTLHLLREASIEGAVQQAESAGMSTDSIYQRNIETLRRLDRDGWEALFEAGSAPPH